MRKKGVDASEFAPPTRESVQAMPHALTASPVIIENDGSHFVLEGEFHQG